MIEIYATVASHHGTALATIDGGPESKVNYKAAQRSEQVFLWRSPILPNREHVLKIRVAGDGVVTADRFDISVSDKPDVTTATLRRLSPRRRTSSPGSRMPPASVVDPPRVKVSLDAVPVAAQVTKAAPITTMTYAPPQPFLPGSTHSIKIEAKDWLARPLRRNKRLLCPRRSSRFRACPARRVPRARGDCVRFGMLDGLTRLYPRWILANKSALPGFTGNFKTPTCRDQPSHSARPRRCRVIPGRPTAPGRSCRPERE